MCVCVCVRARVCVFFIGTVYALQREAVPEGQNIHAVNSQILDIYGDCIPPKMLTSVYFRSSFTYFSLSLPYLYIVSYLLKNQAIDFVFLEATAVYFGGTVV